MDTLQYLERQRLLQKANIYNSFYDPNDATSTTDEIEKSHYHYDNEGHKYLMKIISRKTGKIRYSYQEHKTKMIDGESQKIDDMNEIVFPNNEKSSIYTKQDIKDAFAYVSNISGVVKPKKIRRSVDPKSNSKYLDFRVDNIGFVVRMSDHTYSDVSDAVLTPIYCGVNDVWSIDTLVGKYKPQDLPIIVNNLRNAIKTYNSKNGLTIIKAFVKKNLPKYTSGRKKDVVARHLVAKFMTEKQIDEDRLGVSHVVLENIIYKMLGS